MVRLLSVFTFIAAVTLLNSSVPATRTAKQERILVCVVSAYQPPEMTMDPVVIVENGKFTPPYKEYDEASQKQFAKKYFNPGQRYRLMFGGGEAGAAVIKKWDVGCNRIHATVNVETTARIRGQIRGLATDSPTIGRKPTSRRAPTEEERAAVMELVRKIYRSRGTTLAQLRLLKTTNLTATDLEGDGRLELIGSFVIEGPGRTRRDLLLIAEPDDKSFREGLVEYQSYRLPPEGFGSGIDFVDQLDTDNDGIGEVFAIQQGFDAYLYLIYQKQNGRWLKVYEVMGDAC